MVQNSILVGFMILGAEFIAAQWESVLKRSWWAQNLGLGTLGYSAIYSSP
jgi:hypothetical protein